MREGREGRGGEGQDGVGGGRGDAPVYMKASSTRWRSTMDFIRRSIFANLKKRITWKSIGVCGGREPDEATCNGREKRVSVTGRGGGRGGRGSDDVVREGREGSP